MTIDADFLDRRIGDEPANEFSRRRFVAGAASGALAIATYSAWRSAPHALAADEAKTLPSRIGFSGDFASAASDSAKFVVAFESAIALGANTIRFPVDWARVEARPRTYDWSPYTDLHRELVWHGLQGTIVIVGAPDWLGSDEVATAGDGQRYAIGDAALNALGDFSLNAVAEFTRFGQAVNGIEICPRANAKGSRISAEVFGRMVESVTLTVNALVTPDDGAHKPPAVCAGALLADQGTDWRPYVEAASRSIIPIEVALDLVNATGGQSLDASATKLAKQVADLTDSPLSLNLSAPAVGSPDGDDWEATRNLAAGAGLAHCGGITINPLHQSLSSGQVAAVSTTYPEGAPLLTRDWEPTNASSAVANAWRV